MTTIEKDTMTATIPAPVGYQGGGDAWAEWLEVVAADVKGEALFEESARLREVGNLVRWLRALSALESDVNARIGDARLRLEAARPEPGSPGMKAWYDLQREGRGLHANRVRFRQAVNERLIECRDALQRANIHERLTSESLLQQIARAAAMLNRDDPEAAEGLLNNVLSHAEAVL